MSPGPLRLREHVNRRRTVQLHTSIVPQGPQLLVQFVGLGRQFHALRQPQLALLIQVLRCIQSGLCWIQPTLSVRRSTGRVIANPIERGSRCTFQHTNTLWLDCFTDATDLHLQEIPRVGGSLQCAPRLLEPELQRHLTRARARPPLYLCVQAF